MLQTEDASRIRIVHRRSPSVFGCDAHIGIVLQALYLQGCVDPRQAKPLEAITVQVFDVYTSSRVLGKALSGCSGAGGRFQGSIYNLFEQIVRFIYIYIYICISIT